MSVCARPSRAELEEDCTTLQAEVTAVQQSKDAIITRLDSLQAQFDDRGAALEDEHRENGRLKEEVKSLEARSAYESSQFRRCGMHALNFR